MKIFLKSIIGLLIFGAIITGCADFGEDKSEPIDGGLYVDMVEALDSVQRVLNLFVETEKQYDCSNYVIETNLSIVEDSVLLVKIGKVYKGNYCYTQKGPARGFILIPDTAWEKQYVRFEMDNFSKDVVISKDSSEYYLDMVDAVDFQAKRNVLKRVPENTIWGLLEYSNESSEAYVDTFYNYMDTLGVTSAVLEDGDYYFFQVENGAMVNPSELVKSSVFIKHYEGSFSRLMDLAYGVYYETEGDMGVRVMSSKAQNYVVGY